MRLNDYEWSAFFDFFKREFGDEYKIINSSVFKKKIEDYNYIRDDEDIVETILEYKGAKNIPLDWLDFDKVIESDLDYMFIVDDLYFNVYQFKDEISIFLDENILVKLER